MVFFRKIPADQAGVNPQQPDMFGWHLGNGGTSDVSLIPISPELYNRFVEVVKRSWGNARKVLSYELLHAANTSDRVIVYGSGKRLTISLILMDIFGRYSFALPLLPRDGQPLGLPIVAEEILRLSGLVQRGVTWKRGSFRGRVVLDQGFNKLLSDCVFAANRFNHPVTGGTQVGRTESLSTV